MKLLIYPSHADDFFIVTTSEAFSLLPLTPTSTKEWNTLNAALPSIIRATVHREYGDEVPPHYNPQLASLPDGITIGVEISTEPTNAWMYGAFLYLLQDLWEVEQIPYGSDKHKLWGDLIGD